ncbi:uncharacterized protein LOC144907468 [Branchiostoma floridae x Branchiostoma belcheri]
MSVEWCSCSTGPEDAGVAVLQVQRMPVEFLSCSCPTDPEDAGVCSCSTGPEDGGVAVAVDTVYLRIDGEDIWRASPAVQRDRGTSILHWRLSRRKMVSIRAVMNRYSARWHRCPVTATKL